MRGNNIISFLFCAKIVKYTKILKVVKIFDNTEEEKKKNNERKLKGK